MNLNNKLRTKETHFSNNSHPSIEHTAFCEIIFFTNIATLHLKASGFKNDWMQTIYCPLTSALKHQTSLYQILNVIFLERIFFFFLR